MRERRCDLGEMDAGVRSDEPGAARSPAEGAPGPLLRLQGAAGNRAVTGLVQTKLMVGPHNDEHERQADRVASGDSHVDDRRRGPAPPTAGGTEPAPGVVEAGIAQARGGGRPLPEGLRNEMEGLLGADFHDVRLHAGPRPAAMNRKLHSRAFTTGRDIFLGPGQDDLQSRRGHELIAHELTHVQQQAGGTQTIQACNFPGCTGKHPTSKCPKKRAAESKKKSAEKSAKRQTVAASGVARGDHHKRPGRSGGRKNVPKKNLEKMERRRAAKYGRTHGAMAVAAGAVTVGSGGASSSSSSSLPSSPASSAPATTSTAPATTSSSPTGTSTSPVVATQVQPEVVEAETDIDIDAAPLPVADVGLPGPAPDVEDEEEIPELVVGSPQPEPSPIMQALMRDDPFDFD